MKLIKFATPYDLMLTVEHISSVKRVGVYTNITQTNGTAHKIHQDFKTYEEILDMVESACAPTPTSAPKPSATRGKSKTSAAESA